MTNMFHTALRDFQNQKNKKNKEFGLGSDNKNKMRLSKRTSIICFRANLVSSIQENT